MKKRLVSLILAAVLTALLLVPAAMAEDDSVPATAGYYYVYTENGKGLNVRFTAGGEILQALLIYFLRLLFGSLMPFKVCGQIAFTLDVCLDFLCFSLCDFFVTTIIFVALLYLQIGEIIQDPTVFQNHILIEVSRTASRVADTHPTFGDGGTLAFCFRDDQHGLSFVVKTEDGTILVIFRA